MRARPRRIPLALMLAAALVAVASPAFGYWLKVRRGGPSAILAAARAELAGTVRVARYERDVLEDSGEAKLTIEVARRPAAIPGSKAKGSDVSVRVTDAKGGLLAALAVVKGRLTVRIGKAKPSHEPAALFRTVPQLGVPLVLWAPLELTALYRVKLEGEFKGTALLRMVPDYTAPRGYEPLKLGVSKRTLSPTVTEVIDTKGVPVSRLVWDAHEKRGEQRVAAKIRLRTLQRKTPMDFALTAFVSGPKTKARFGAAALR